MASITTRPNGSRFITFHDGAGQPRHITLGKTAKRYAEAFKVRVEDLASAALHGHAPSDDTVRWLASLEDRLYEKLVAVGLAPDRQSATLEAAVEQYIAEREGELKPESVRKLRQTQARLLEHFDGATPLRKITPQDAAAWRRRLKDDGLSEAAVRTHCGNVKTMVAAAVRRKSVATNPFDELRSGPTPSAYTRYVTPDEIERVIDACPDSEWRLLFGLARYVGLRIPSESHGLRWADVDFARSRLTVRSPKTERWAGHEQRVVPITSKLMVLLRERFEAMPEGESPLVTIGGKGAVLRRVRQICRRAGVEPWKRLWQTLRSSCEKEWAMRLPQYAVSRWIGHSIVVSGRHYANAVPDELFDIAAGIVPTGAASTAETTPQVSAAELGVGSSAKNGSPGGSVDANDVPSRSVPCGDASAQRQAQRKASEASGTSRKRDRSAVLSAESDRARDNPENARVLREFPLVAITTKNGAGGN